MNTQQINSALGLIIGVLSVLGTFVAVTRYYRERLKELIDRQSTAAKKEYAAERAFIHLENNYKQLQSSLDILTREAEAKLDRVSIRLIRLETVIHILAKDITGDSVSPIEED